MPLPAASALKIGDILQYLDPADWRTVPRWPPTAFGIAATILRVSGAYIRVVNKWPPSEPANSWADQVKTVGLHWRAASIDETLGVPAQLQTWWDVIVREAEIALDLVCREGSDDLHVALAQIVAASDEASVGIGLPGSTDDFEEKALTTLVTTSSVTGGENATLCPDIDRSRFTVLPKSHTPQTGITTRSLTHHLALCIGCDVNVRWRVVPQFEKRNACNLLILPWPLSVRAEQFSPAGDSKGLRNLATGFRFFDYKPGGENPNAVAARALANAESQVGRVDGMILPELALTRPQHSALRRQVLRGRNDFLLVSGVSDASIDPLYSRNYAAVDSALGLAADEQDKHHRWQLDGQQIKQYGLEHRLDPRLRWWESCWLDKRSITFIALRDWLTVCVVVCEDLCRPDPLSDVIRSVGPNLVIAILMDGPQLPSRWSARYATVLTDDPGCSVLTVTSLGMSVLSKPVDSRHEPPKRVIGLWRDSVTGAKQLELEENSVGLLLLLENNQCEEWTADGRSDGGVTGRPVYISGQQIVV